MHTPHDLVVKQGENEERVEMHDGYFDLGRPLGPARWNSPERAILGLLAKCLWLSRVPSWPGFIALFIYLFYVQKLL